jgi:hypothetical protein
MERSPFTFSLHFAAPAGAGPGQGICEVRHARLGTFPLFVVPVGRPGDLRRYQAVISHI